MHRPQAETGIRSPIYRWACGISYGLLTATSLLLGSFALAPSLPHKLELLSHFYPQLCLGLGLPLLAFGLLRHLPGAALSLLAASLLTAPLQPYLSLWPAPHPATPANCPPDCAKLAPELKLLLANVLITQTNPRQLENLLNSEQPNLVVLEELNLAHQQLMDSRKDYPYRHLEYTGDPFGLGVWSKVPFAHSETLTLGPAGLPSLYLRLQQPGRKEPLHLIATHPFPPIEQPYFEQRNAQLQELASFIQSLNGPKILLGDLNLTPWSPVYRQLERTSGLHNTRHGFGLQPSWPTHWPALLRIPIDHCLVSPELQVLDTRTGPELGSDHLPLLVRLR